jgi:hypothetical protein
MIDTSASVCSDRDAPWVVTMGVLVGVSMFSLSLVGLLGRLTTASVVACLVLSSATGVVYARRSRAYGVQLRAWMALPLLLPSTLAAFLPPYTWDEVAYGAALPRDFARAGRFFYNPEYGVHMAFPGNYEALVTASWLLTGDVVVTQLVNVALALGLAVIAVMLARVLGVSRAVSLAAGLFVLCAPALIEVTPRTKNDVAAAFFQALALLVLAECLERPAYPSALLAGAFLGVALGIKYSSLHFVFAIAPLAVVLLIGSAASRRTGLKLVLVWGASLAAFALPWYLRNIVLFGNPVFPFMNDVLGAHNGFTPVHSALLRESVEGLGDFSFSSGLTRTFGTQVAKGFGLLPVLVLLPGAVLALRSPPRRTGVLLAGSAITYGFLTLLVGFWFPRYFLSLLVIASALAALALERLGNALGRGRLTPSRLTRLALLAVAVFAVRDGFPYWRQHWQDFNAMMHEGRAAFAEGRAPYFGVARWLNAHMKDGDKVAIGFNVQPFYYLEGSYYHIHPLTEGDLVTAQTPEDVERLLRRTGATLLAISGSDGTFFPETAPKISAYRERLWQAQRHLRKTGRLRLLAKVQGVRIYGLGDVRTDVGGDFGAGSAVPSVSGASTLRDAR